MRIFCSLASVSLLLMLNIVSAFSSGPDDCPWGLYSESGRLPVYTSLEPSEDESTVSEFFDEPVVPQHIHHQRAENLSNEVRIALVNAYDRAIRNKSRTPRKDAAEEVNEMFDIKVTRGAVDYTLGKWRYGPDAYLLNNGN